MAGVLDGTAPLTRAPLSGGIGANIDFIPLLLHLSQGHAENIFTLILAVIRRRIKKIDTFLPGVK